MTVGCLFITTNLNRRLNMVEDAIRSIDKYGFDFDKKIISVDCIDPSGDISFFNRFKGWEIVFNRGNKEGLNGHQKKALQHIDTDYLFYFEDKLKVLRLPSKEKIEKIMEGFEYICFNMHMTENFCEPPDNIVDYINQKNNYKKIGCDLFLIKSPELSDDYYLNFPACIVKTNMFKKLQSLALKNYPDLPVEVSINKIWLKYYRDKKVAIYVQPDTISKRPMNLMDFFYQSCIKYWNNCPDLRVRSIKVCESRLSAEYIRRKKILETYENKRNLV